MLISERNKFLLIFLCLLLPIVIFTFHPLYIDETGYKFIFFNYFTAGIAVGIIAYIFGAVDDKVNSSKVLYAIPSFFIVAAIGSPIVKEFLPFQVDIVRNHKIISNSGDIVEVLPVYGYISRFVAGLILIFIVISLVNAIKSKTIKTYFQFRITHLIWLLVPYVLGYMDYAILLSLTWSNRRMMLERVEEFEKLIYIFITILSIFLTFIISFFIVQLFIKNVQIKKKSAIIVMSCLTLFCLFFLIGIPYLKLSQLPIIKNVYDNENATFLFPILCGGLCGLTYKTAFGKINKLNNIDTVKDNVHMGNRVDIE